MTADSVSEFLHDVIAWADGADSHKADRAAMLADSLLAKIGAAAGDKCLASLMGYPAHEHGHAGPIPTVASGVLTRAHDALREFGQDVDMATVLTGLAAAGRIVRTSAKASPEGCTVLLVGAGLAPKHISHKVPRRAEPLEPRPDRRPVEPIPEDEAEAE